MLERIDQIRLLRIIAAFAIVIYLYDIILCISGLINPTAIYPAYTPYFTGNQANTDTGLFLRTYIFASFAIALIISIAEIIAGLNGLKGHIARWELILCLITAILCVFCIALLFLSGESITKCLEESLEFFVSGIVVFLYWLVGRKVIKERPAKRTPGHDDHVKAMRVVGGLTMLFAVWDALTTAASLIDPSLVGMDSLFAGNQAASAWLLLIIATIIGLAIAAVQFYFGYIAFKERPTKLAAWLSLAVCVITATGLFANMTTDGLNTAYDFAQSSCAVLALLYWIYYRHIMATAESR